MKTFSSFNKYIEKSIINNWNQNALTDYKGITLQYHDVARKIEKLHILFEYDLGADVADSRDTLAVPAVGAVNLVSFGT